MARSSRHPRGGAPTFPRSGAGGLPPELSAFLMGQYGPAFKAVQDAQTRPNPVRVLPRTTQFLSEQERMRRVSMYGRDKPPDMLSNAMLRAISRNSMINVAIHSVRRARMRAVCRKWDGTHPGWAIVHHEHFKHDFDATKIDGLPQRIAAIEPLFLCPHPRFDTSLMSLMVKATEDHLALDRVAINMIRGRLDGIATSGPVQLTHVDGSTIWPVDLYLDHFVRLNGLTAADGSLDLDAGMAHFYEMTGVRLDDCAYLQVDPQRSIDPIAYLAHDELLLAIANPSPEINHWGYGRPPAEESFQGSSMFLHGLAYVAGFFRDAFADTAVLLYGSDYQDEDVNAITQLLRVNHAGPGRHHHAPLIQLAEKGDLEFVETRKQGARDMQYNETMHLVAMLVCAPYSIDPSEINLDPKGPGRNSLSERDRGDEIKDKRDIGDLSLCHFMAEHVLSPIVQAHDPDLRFVWLGLDEDDEKLAVELLTKQQDYHLSIDEARRQRGAVPFNEPWSAVPKWRAQQIAQQADQAEAQQRQMKMQMEQQRAGIAPQQGAPGASGAQQGEAGPQGDEDAGQDQPQRPPMPQHMDWDGGGGGKGMIEFTVEDRDDDR